MSIPQITHSRYLVQKFLYEHIPKFIESVNSNHANLKVLDLGCGQKPFRDYFTHTSLYAGVDLRSKFADVHSIAENLPFEDLYFDVVLCTQVLEHVSDPEKVLEEIRRVLIEKGVLILSTHGFWIEAHEPTDYWRWTLQGLEKIMKSAGFYIVDVSSMDPISSTLQTLALWLPYKSPFFTLVNLAALTLNKLLKSKGPRLHIVHIIKAVKE